MTLPESRLMLLLLGRALLASVLRLNLLNVA